jgi:hypothetical protein
VQRGVSVRDEYTSRDPVIAWCDLGGLHRRERPWVLRLESPPTLPCQTRGLRITTRSSMDRTHPPKHGFPFDSHDLVRQLLASHASVINPAIDWPACDGSGTGLNPASITQPGFPPTSN